MDKNNVQRVRTFLNNELVDMEKRLYDELGVKATLGKSSYNEEACTFKLIVSEVGENGEVSNPFTKNFIDYSFSHGIAEEAIGKDFMVKGEKFELVGFNPRAKKWPFIGKNKDGEEFKFTEKALSVLKNKYPYKRKLASA
jgi:hypothetical protein